MRRVLQVLGFFVCVFVMAMPAWSFDFSRAKKLYQDNCAGCHGESGRPVMVNTPDFTRGEGLQRIDSELIDSIEVGRNQMPGFQGMLSREELADMVVYLRTLWVR